MILNPQYKKFLKNTGQMENKTNKKYFLPPLIDKTANIIPDEVEEVQETEKDKL